LFRTTKQAPIWGQLTDLANQQLMLHSSCNNKTTRGITLPKEKRVATRQSTLKDRAWTNPMSRDMLPVGRRVRRLPTLGLPQPSSRATTTTNSPATHSASQTTTHQHPSSRRLGTLNNGGSRPSPGPRTNHSLVRSSPGPHINNSLGRITILPPSSHFSSPLISTRGRRLTSHQ